MLAFLPLFVGSETSVVKISEICSEIRSLSNDGDGFDNIQTADIDELMQDDKDVNIDEDEGKCQVLTPYLIREGLKYATGLQQHCHDHYADINCVLKFQRKLKSCVAGYRV